MDSLLRDVRFALRSLRRRAHFAVVALAILTLGVGASTSVYSVVDGILFRPLPFREPERLTAVWLTYPHWKKEPVLARMWDNIPISIPEFREWRQRQRSFEDVAISGTTRMMLGVGEARERVDIVRASASMLHVLSSRPFMGRFFSAEEDAVGGTPVTVLSYENWESRFSRDPNVLGRIVRFDEGPYTVIGVLPRGLSLRHGEPTAPFWMPVGQDSANARQSDNHNFQGLGRLRPGVTLATATHESAPLLDGGPTTQWKHGVRLQEWQADLTRDVRKPMLLLLGAVLLLMLVASVNVAMLLLGEATAREQEMASRIALGAGRWRIVRLLLTESAVLGGLGAFLGTAAAWGGTKVLVALAPANIPGLASVQLDLRVVGFGILLSLLTAMCFGVAPAIALARKDPSSVLRGGRGQSGRRGPTLQPILVAAELALSFILLVSAAMLSRSFVKLTAVEPGFRAENLMALRISVPRAKARDTSFTGTFYDRVATQIAALPGVAAVTATSTHPFGGGSSSSGFEKEGEALAQSQRREAQQRVVLPGHFRTMGIELLAGRDFSSHDNASGRPVVIVSEALVARDYVGESPIGRIIRWQGEWREIVGIVADVKYSKLARAFDPTVYTPQAQMRYSGLTLMVRTQTEATGMLSSMRAAVRAVDQDVVVLGADRMTDLIRRSFAEERYRTLLIDVFGISAVLLAAAGMYGVVSRTVGRRRKELGIRIALGATSRSVMALVLSSTLTGLLAGITIGVIGALTTARFIGAFLYGVPASDPWTYAAASVLLALVSLAAAWLPARWASRVHPATVLRAD